MTTYAENMGVMAVHAASIPPLVFVVVGRDRAGARIVAEIKGAPHCMIPGTCAGRLPYRGVRPDRCRPRDASGLKTASTSRDSRNLLVAAITLRAGHRRLTLKFGEFAIGSMGTATFGAILLNALLSRGER